MTTNKKRPRDFLSLVNVREELQLSGMRIDPSGAMGRRWSGVERVWAFLRVRPRQRALITGLDDRGLARGGLEGAGICSLWGAYWFGV